MTRKQKTTCPTCKRRFKSLGTHWQNNPSHREGVDEEKMDILTGVLMGDGTIHMGNDENPYMQISMINKEYLEYIDDRFGWLTNGVKFQMSGEDISERNEERGFDSNVGEHNYHDLYRLCTISHPDLVGLSSWYSTNEKRFPDSLRLNPTILKHWYCCDGGLSWPGSTGGYRARAGISSTNESDRVGYLQSLFNDVDLETYWNSGGVWMNPSQTEKFLGYIGSPVPGFKYKWENKRKHVYERLKKEAYEQDYESPQKTLKNWDCYA